ncbi:hypothetical protein AVEN_200127-1, partial [Araneus ventricosus]
SCPGYVETTVDNRVFLLLSFNNSPSHRSNLASRLLASSPVIPLFFRHRKKRELDKAEM